MILIFKTSEGEDNRSRRSHEEESRRHPPHPLWGIHRDEGSLRRQHEKGQFRDQQVEHVVLAHEGDRERHLEVQEEASQVSILLHIPLNSLCLHRMDWHHFHCPQWAKNLQGKY